MLLAISIAIVQQAVFLSYLFESSFFTQETSDETRAIMVAVALFSALLSIPASAWNIVMVKEAKEKRDIISLIISVGTFVFGAGYIIFSIIHRLHVQGGRLF